MDHLSGSAFGKITIEKGQMVAAIFPQDKWSVPTGNVIVARLHLTSNSLTHTQREPDICTHTRAHARTHARAHTPAHASRTHTARQCGMGSLHVLCVIPSPCVLPHPFLAPPPAGTEGEWWTTVRPAVSTRSSLWTTVSCSGWVRRKCRPSVSPSLSCLARPCGPAWLDWS